MNKSIITKGLKDIGAAWATQAGKYVCCDSACCQLGDKPAYHVHPDEGYPHEGYIKRFSTLAAIDEYIKVAKRADKVADDYIAQFDCPSPEQAMAINDEAARLQMEIWDNYNAGS